MTTNDCIEINTADTIKATVIWLHGLGADGNDFAPIIPELQLPENLGIRFLFPHAPVRPISCNGGYEMRGWYDIYSLEHFEREDEAGLIDSQQRIATLIQQENQRGIACECIILMGFSQGGAVALHTGLRHSQSLAGIGALSSYLPLRNSPVASYSSANKHSPIFMAHGKMDNVISIKHGEQSRDILQESHSEILWKSYQMEHSVCTEEIADIADWLKKCLQQTD
jgi:phospholipase/carboxylesterase